VLDADGVRPANDGDFEVSSPSADEVGAVRLGPGGHRATITLGPDERVIAERAWAPFTDGELSRAQALTRLLASAERAGDLPVTVRTAAGASVIVRVASRTDAAALTDLHERCSAATLFARYHTGMRRLPAGWAHRLLQPPRGHTLLACTGTVVVGFAQLITSADEPRSAELSLLVEDGWQRQGVGTALLSGINGLARGCGVRELIGLCLPDKRGAERTASRLGLATDTRVESGMTRLSIAVGTTTTPLPARHPDARPPGEPRPRGRRTPTCVTSSAQADPLVRQLTSLDAQFLNAETSTMPTHVGIMAILDPATAPGGCLTVEEVRSLVGSRLHLIDPLRWRLRQVPLGLDLPYWVDSVTPDLEHHIREIGLPVPGTDEQLAAQVARLAETPLRREHPLWECYLIHGVAGGRQALYMKVHHAVIDGVSGAEVLAVLMDLHAEPSAAPAPAAAAPRPATSTATLLATSAWHLLSRPTQLLRAAPMMVPHLLELPGASSVPGAGLLGAAAGRVGRLAHLTSAPQLPPRAPTAPPTPFNGPLTPDRCYAFTSVSLPEVKAIKTALGLTINDVVMALCTTALRRWLIDHDALPDVPLVAAMPVSVRTPEQMGTGGNQISFMLCALPTTEPDPTERLRLLNASLTGAKKRFAQTPATLLHAYSTVLPQLFHGVASRALLRAATIGAPPFNLFISNVAGPQLPLHTAGTAVTGLFPVSVVSDIGGGINITVLSYNGHLDFGILACRQMVPDVADLADHLHDALTELTNRTTLNAPTATARTADARVRFITHPQPAFTPA